jgi:hypothetical protein
VRRLAALLLATLLAAGADASLGVRASVEDLTNACDAAVAGVVLDHATALDSAAGAIWTRWRVRVDRALAGDAKDVIVVRVRGGRVGTLEQHTIGAATLDDAERVVLFLGPDAGGARDVIGLGQGAFRVEVDPATGVAECRNSVEGISLVDRAGSDVAAEPLSLPLEELAARVTAAAARKAERRRASEEARERRLAAWRRQAEIHAEQTRGRPGGAP